MIDAQDLDGVDEALARRVLAHTHFIAPCVISLLPGSQEHEYAVAILQGVAAEAKARGSRLVKSERIGPAAVDYQSVDSWFSTDDRNALKALCNVTASAGGSVGSFPPASLVSRVWPEHYYRPI